jgi:hypothetical protein
MQADQRQLEHLGRRFGELGLADSRRAFDQDGFAQVIARYTAVAIWPEQM